MIALERVWEERNRLPVLVVSTIIVALIAFVDWRIEPYVSLGFLYLFPIMLAAAFLPRWIIVALALICAWLSETFSPLERSNVRFAFESLALLGCGLFVAELVRNRRLMLEAQQRLKALVETSPAAIVTVDDRGLIELANQSAHELMAPRGGNLAGSPVAAYLPELHHALRWEEAPQFRASMQCLVHRDNGETFPADVWFSTYKEGRAPKVAAIIADVSEETVTPGAGEAEPQEDSDRTQLTTREIEVLRFLVQGMANKEIAARMEMSESTVKNTLQQLFAKTNVRTRAQLVRVALEHYRHIL